jgi:hypothetical protein
LGGERPTLLWDDDLPAHRSRAMLAWLATQVQQVGGVLLDSSIVLRRWRVSPGWMVGLPPPATDSGLGQALPSLCRAEVTDAVQGSELMDSRNY